jgi:hypothetical protein
LLIWYCGIPDFIGIFSRPDTRPPASVGRAGVGAGSTFIPDFIGISASPQHSTFIPDLSGFRLRLNIHSRFHRDFGFASTFIIHHFSFPPNSHSTLKTVFPYHPRSDKVGTIPHHPPKFHPSAKSKNLTHSLPLRNDNRENNQPQQISRAF